LYIWSPLNQEMRAKWNNKAAIEFFKKTEGFPYGFHNFFYSWIDTPYDNLTPGIPKHFLPIFFNLLSEIDPDTIGVFFTSGLNKRMGVEGKSINDISALAAAKGMLVDDVMAMKEIDGWEYEGMRGN